MSSLAGGGHLAGRLVVLVFIKSFDEALDAKSYLTSMFEKRHVMKSSST